MKALVFLLLLSTTVLTGSWAQDCLSTAFKSGMKFEMSTFSAKDESTGKITYQIKDVHKEGNTTVMDIVAQFQNEKGNRRPPYTIHYICTGNELMADMAGIVQAMSSIGGAEMKLKTNKLLYPAKLSVGQTLSDGQMEAEMISDSTTMMSMTMVMANRQVESKAHITTPAGTFDTYKITSDVNADNKIMGVSMNFTMRVVTYRTNNQIFDIKSENYNQLGKLMGYSLLTKTN